MADRLALKAACNGRANLVDVRVRQPVPQKHAFHDLTESTAIQPRFQSWWRQLIMCFKWKCRCYVCHLVKGGVHTVPGRDTCQSFLWKGFTQYLRKGYVSELPLERLHTVPEKRVRVRATCNHKLTWTANRVLPHRETPSNGYAAILYVLLRVCAERKESDPKTCVPE
jgi:hypothetical protein